MPSGRAGVKAEVGKTQSSYFAPAVRWRARIGPNLPPSTLHPAQIPSGLGLKGRNNKGREETTRMVP
jgi:hypothetical protein